MATGGFDVNLNPLDPSQAILLDVRAYDGADYRAVCRPRLPQNSKTKVR